jgi:hypothetical protein
MKSIDLAVIKPGKVRFVKIDISEAKIHKGQILQEEEEYSKQGMWKG